MSKEKFTTESTVYVSAPSKLTLEQTQHINAEILRIAGCPSCYSGFKFKFIDESEMIAARVAANQEINIG